MRVPGHVVTLLAMQVLVAWVSHSRERMPVSSRTVGAAGAELRGQGQFSLGALPGRGEVRVPPVPTFSTCRGLFS